MTAYAAAPALSYAAAPAFSYAAAPALSYAAAPALSYAAAPAISYAAAPVVAAAPAAVAVASPAVKSQYHAQDELGNTAYGHSEPGQIHTAVQDANGNRVGSFSYLNPTDGQIHRTDYVADALGYRVAANDLPVAPASGPAPVADTPEVVAAREAHLALKRARRSVLAQTPAATTPLAAPVAVAAPVAARALVAPALASPFAYSAAPLAYSAYSAAPLAYSSAPLAYSAAPLAYSAVPAGIPATLTTVVNNPGHAVSYRID